MRFMCAFKYDLFQDDVTVIFSLMETNEYVDHAINVLSATYLNKTLQVKTRNNNHYKRALMNRPKKNQIIAVLYLSNPTL